MYEQSGMSKDHLNKYSHADPPSIERLLQIVSEIFEMENVTFCLRLNSAGFKKKWENGLICM